MMNIATTKIHTPEPCQSYVKNKRKPNEGGIPYQSGSRSYALTKTAPIHS